MLPFFCIAQESTTTETSAPQSEVASSSETQGYPATNYSKPADNAKPSKGLFVEDETQDMIIWFLSAIFFVILWIILPKRLIHFFACLPSIASGQGMVPKSGSGCFVVLVIAILAAVMLTKYVANWFY